MESKSNLDAIFHGLADPYRRKIIEEISEGPKKVSELADLFDITLAAVSKHIRVLEKAGIVYKIKNGRTVYCHLNFDIWNDVMSFVSLQAHFWRKRLSELEDFIGKNYEKK